MKSNGCADATSQCGLQLPVGSPIWEANRIGSPYKRLYYRLQANQKKLVAQRMQLRNFS